MRDYIKRLARGNFIYQRPQLKLETDSINGSITAGDCCMFTFQISAKEEIKGVVSSDNRRVYVKEKSFCGTAVTIEYTVDAANLTEGKTIQGQFYIVSSAGELSVKYEFAVEAEKMHTSMGDAYNMFHFANLVQVSPEEAAGIFLSPDFKRIFLKNDMVQGNIYDTVKNTKNVNEAMEEFLIAVRKKAPVTISLSHEEKVFPDFTESVKESVTIVRSGWGYADIAVSTDAAFIQPKVSGLTSEDFTGNKYELEYVIDAQKLHAGKNWGKIHIRTFHQEYTVRIEVQCREQVHTKMVQKQAVLSLVKEYLDFRMKRQDKKNWQDNSHQILDRVRGINDSNAFFKLAQAQIFLIQNRYEDASWLIENVKNEILEHKEQHVELYCYFLYVSALYYRDKSYTFGAVKVIKEYYENGYDTWRILWILFYIDAAQDSNKSIKLLRLKDTFHNGCTSPIMYYEALQILNGQPTLLRVLNDFELQVLQFGCKYKLITSKLAMYVCELISNEKIANIKYLKLLYALNDIFDNDEILTVLVTHMIRNELTAPEYTNLYEKGILRGLRITRLYEFYIESLDKKNMKRLPQIVLRYFTYESSLSDRSRAYLYANILINLGSSKDTMHAYGAQIERFGYEQMKKGHIDTFLEVIYRYLFRNIIVNEETAGFLSRYLFTYKITLFDEKITSVLIKHKELRRGQRCPVVNGVAYVQMYTKDCVIMFEDEDKTVRKGSLHYEIERVFENPSYMEQVCAYCSNDLYIRLFLYEQNLEGRRNDEEALFICMQLMENGYVNQQARELMNSWLIQYYHEYYHGEDFKEGCANIKKERLNAKDAALLIETCIVYGMHEEAYDLICVYGFHGVASPKLLRMVRNIILLRPQEYHEKLLQCCVAVFEEGKYDENVLSYLAEYYNAGSVMMMKVWRACVGFKVPCSALAERLIAQRLFVGNLGDRLSEVFTYYYQNRADSTVVLAYIAENAYQYFVKQAKIDEKVFEYIAAFLIEEKTMPQVCAMGYLKHYAEYSRERLTETHILLLQKILDTLCTENILFAFYADYKGCLAIPYNAADKTTIEYRAPSTARVQIFYRRNEEEDYQSEVLSCVAGGVYTKSFSLFYGDSIQYYFTEENHLESKRTETGSVLCNNVTPKEPEGRYDYINDMLVSMEMHDMATMKKIMQGYCVQNYVTQQLFKPM